jgi:hypothetical protein
MRRTVDKVIARILLAGLCLAGGTTACSEGTKSVDFCAVLATPSDFVDRTFTTEIVAIAGRHASGATSIQCKDHGIGFAPANFSESPDLKLFFEEMERAQAQGSPTGTHKAVLARVTAQVVRADGPQGFKLHLATIHDHKIVDLPSGFFDPPGGNTK